MHIDVESEGTVLKGYFDTLARTTVDIIKNAKTIFLLAKFDYEVESRDFFLGKAWKMIMPLVRIGVYWFVFGVGIRNGRSIDGYAYILWLSCGITPWFILSRGINYGSGAILRKSSMISRSNVPTIIVPISDCISVIMEGIWSVIVMIIILFANKASLSLYCFEALYYIVCIAALIASVNMVTSVLTMIARDFSKVLQTVMRVMFFLSPVMWKPVIDIAKWYQVLNWINPFVYVVEGFRKCFLYKESFVHSLDAMAVFWCTVILIYLVGVACQEKMRNNILSYI